MNWRRLNGEIIVEPILEAVEKTILSEKQCNHRLKVCIGTDSQSKGADVDFASVIVFQREKKGGFMFIQNSTLKRTMSLRERMIIEVSRSVEIAYDLYELLDRYHVDMEVHADINTDPQFESSIALKEAMGYIKSMGFAFKMKPNAYASSCCADKVI